MPSGYTEIVEINQYQKPNKSPFIIYEDLECKTEKIDGCKNTPENSSTTKVSELYHRVFQSLQYLQLEPQKIRMMCTEVKTA